MKMGMSEVDGGHNAGNMGEEYKGGDREINGSLSVMQNIQ